VHQADIVRWWHFHTLRLSTILEVNMSEQSVLAFVEKAGSDRALQKQIDGLPGDMSALVQLASAAGFNFTTEEWKAVAASSFGELSESALDNVAGGAAGQIDPCFRPAAVEPCIKPTSFQGGIFSRFG